MTLYSFFEGEDPSSEENPRADLLDRVAGKRERCAKIVIKLLSAVGLLDFSKLVIVSVTCENEGSI